MAQSKSSFDADNPEALNDLINGLSDPDLMESALRQGAASAITVLRQEIQMRTPVQHGYLRDSVSAAYVPDESRTGKVATYETVFMGTAPNQPSGKPGMRNADVANWVEYGTSRMSGEPFVRPAYEAKRQEAADACADKITEVLTSDRQTS